MNNITHINEKLLKILGVDYKYVSEVYVCIKANEVPRVAIVKHQLNTEEPEVTQFRLVPLEE